jgi:DNA (cytosine-5)-methyltransferase 1
MRLISLFSGCGGLDLGFRLAGFDIVWANEFDREIWQTFEENFSETILDKRSIVDVPSEEILDADGIIGGPPCQSWSAAGSKRGITDPRGQLFHQYVRIVTDKQPKFFLAENVQGILASRHAEALTSIEQRFTDAGYIVKRKLFNAEDFGIPQERKRVIFIGLRRDLVDSGTIIPWPELVTTKLTLRDVIWNLKESAVPAGHPCLFPNHEYYESTYSPHYMSRNRVRDWNEVSFTIQAGARHAPIHPQANKMIKIGKDLFVFDEENTQAPYRRLTVRECARVQTFPDNFIFHYKNVIAGYKMVGNAVPVEFARKLAEAIFSGFSKQ